MRVLRVSILVLVLLVVGVTVALLSDSFAFGVAAAGFTVLLLLAVLYLVWERGVFGESAGEVQKSEDEETGFRERVGALLSFGPGGGGGGF